MYESLLENPSQKIRGKLVKTIERKFYKEEFEKLGINVGEAQVRQLLRLQLAQNPNFVNEVGMFDENKLQ
jgi:hypothetical protein